MTDLALGPRAAAIPRPFPLQTLLDATGLNPAHFSRVTKASGRDIALALAYGCTESQADRWAIRCGHHPALIWQQLWWATAPASDTKGMTVKIALDNVAELARRYKVEQVRKHGGADEHPGDSDLPPVALVVQDGAVIAEIHGAGDMDAPRSIAFWGAAMWGDDAEVLLITDSVRASDPEGAPAPAQGDLSRRWISGDREGLEECLVVVRMAPDQPASMMLFPYERTGRSLKWTSDQHDKIGKIEGGVPDAYVDGLAQHRAALPEMKRTMAAAARGMGKEATDWHMNRAMARFVSSQHAVGAVAVAHSTDSPEAALFIDGEEVPLG
jgi:hypothetical protein